MRQGNNDILYFFEDGDGEYFDACDKLSEMLDSGDMDWCEDTLISIQEWSEEKGMLTGRQIKSVNNFYERYIHNLSRGN